MILSNPASEWTERGVTYTTVSTVCTTALLGRLVDLDVLDDQVAGVETFGVCVRFGVFEETEEELGGFFGPAGFGDAELFAWETRSISAVYSTLSFTVFNVEQGDRAITSPKIAILPS